MFMLQAKESENSGQRTLFSLPSNATELFRETGDLMPFPTSHEYHNSECYKSLFCCVRFLYIFPTGQGSPSARDPAPPFVQGAAVYVHIRYGAFVALDISEVLFMGIVSVIRLFRECYSIAGCTV